MGTLPTIVDDRRHLPIGVFDSGVGGLTVLEAIHRLLPQEDLVYLGDTARVPYGTKSPDSVLAYVLQATKVLVGLPVKALVVACNTASAVAVAELSKRYPDIPIIGVVEPGADASCQASVSGHIGVIATESTIQGGAYHAAIKARRTDAEVVSQACSLFVALAEEGWTEGSLVEQIVAEYLDPLLCKAKIEHLELDCLVLGCTHFPVLKQSIAAVVGDDIKLVDSALTTAEVLVGYLDCLQLCRKQSEHAGNIEFMVTDGVERFARVASIFFAPGVCASQVKLIDIHHKL